MGARLPLPKRNRGPLGGVCEQNSRSQRRPQGWGGLRERVFLAGHPVGWLTPSPPDTCTTMKL